MNNMLSEKPIIGILSPIIGAGASLFEVLTPLLQFVALILGIVVGIVTLLIKIQDYRIQRSEIRNNHEHPRNRKSDS